MRGPKSPERQDTTSDSSVASFLRNATQPYEGLTHLEMVLAIALAGLSGAGILVHTFGPVPMSFSAPFVVLPGSCLLGGAILLKRGLPGRFHAFSSALLIGAAWGLAATLVYDAVRPAMVWAFGLDFDPYRAIFFFGELITGEPRSEAESVIAGWTYHFWNGISFGMIFALLRPKGGMLAGLVWAETLQVLMMIAYPSFLEVRLDNPGFLMTGIIGHGLWGVVLGEGIRRTTIRREAAR